MCVMVNKFQARFRNCTRYLSPIQPKGSLIFNRVRIIGRGEMEVCSKSFQKVVKRLRAEIHRWEECEGSLYIWWEI